MSFSVQVQLLVLPVLSVHAQLIYRHLSVPPSFLACNTWSQSHPCRALLGKGL